MRGKRVPKMRLTPFESNNARIMLIAHLEHVSWLRSAQPSRAVRLGTGWHSLCSGPEIPFATRLLGISRLIRRLAPERTARGSNSARGRLEIGLFAYRVLTGATKRPAPVRAETHIYLILQQYSGDPRKTRTSGLRFRKPPLYPAELWGLCLLQGAILFHLTIWPEGSQMR